MSNLRQKLIKLGQYLVEISLSVCNLRGKFISIFQGRHFWFTNYKILSHKHRLQVAYETSLY